MTGKRHEEALRAALNILLLDFGVLTWIFTS